MDSLRAVLTEAEHQLADQGEVLMRGYLENCDKARVKALATQLHKMIQEDRMADAVTAMLLVLGRIASKTNVPGATVEAFSQMLDTFFEEEVKLNERRR